MANTCGTIVPRRTPFKILLSTRYGTDSFIYYCQVTLQMGTRHLTCQIPLWLISNQACTNSMEMVSECFPKEGHILRQHVLIEQLYIPTGSVTRKSKVLTFTKFYCTLDMRRRDTLTHVSHNSETIHVKKKTKKERVPGHCCIQRREMLRKDI